MQTLVLIAALVTAAAPSGDAAIRAKAGTSEIVIRTTSRLAGAIDSLTWNGKEFIDSADHGRQLQSASNFDVGTRFTPETFNPTEAGSRGDGAGPTSTSKLLSLQHRRELPRDVHTDGLLVPPRREVVRQSRQEQD